MTIHRSVTVFVFAWLLVGINGCSAFNKPTVRSVDMTVRDKDGHVAIEFDKWYLVFEAIPTKDVQIGSTGYIYFPLPGGQGGGSGTSHHGKLKIQQSFNGTENSVTVNEVKFKIVEGGSRLLFDDHTFQSKGSLRTIIVSMDGKTKDMSSE